MNPDEKTLTLEESIKQVMQTLPPVIRAYLAEGKYTMVAKGLMSKYGLRIDQGGVLEREIMLLLMGIENPDDFTKALATEARLDQKMISGIVQDINTQIFIPLREAEMKGKTGGVPAPAPQPARPASVGVPRYAPPATVLPPQRSYAPPPQSPRYANQQDDAAVNAFVHRVEPSPATTPPQPPPPPSISVIKPPPAPPAVEQRPGPPPNLPGAVAPKSDILPPAPKAPPPAPGGIDPYREPL